MSVINKMQPRGLTMRDSPFSHVQRQRHQQQLPHLISQVCSGLANSAGPTSDHCRAAGSPAAHVCDPDAAVYCVTDPAHFLRVPTHDLYAALRDDLGGAHRLQKGCGFPHVAAERTQAADQEFNFWWWLCVCHTA